jgi:hypothetical protein
MPKPEEKKLLYRDVLLPSVLFGEKKPSAQRSPAAGFSPNAALTSGEPWQSSTTPGGTLRACLKSLLGLP